MYRVLRKNLKSYKIDVLVLTDDLKLVWGHEKIPYREPKGDRWSGYSPSSIPEEVVKENLEFLKSVLEREDYDEIYVALSRSFRKAIGQPEKVFYVKVTYIEGRGLGPYTRHLKKWLESV